MLGGNSFLNRWLVSNFAERQLSAHLRDSYSALLMGSAGDCVLVVSRVSRVGIYFAAILSLSWKEELIASTKFGLCFTR